MTWFVLGLVVLAAVGPVLWVLPSRADRQRMRLRQRAMAAGAQVRLAFLPDVNATAQQRVSAGGVQREPQFQCMMYRKFARLPAGASAPHWRWLRCERAINDGTAASGWVLDPSLAPVEMPPEYWAPFAVFAEELTADIVALEVTATDVALGWRERGGEAQADQLLVSVELLAGLQRRWFERIVLDRPPR